MPDEIYEGEYYEGRSTDQSTDQSLARQEYQLPIPMGAGMVQAHTPFVSAMQVLKPRNMELVEKNILRQAALLGHKAMYGWGAGKGRVEGVSIKMAMIMFNAFGNTTIVAQPLQETAEAWVFTHYIVDLESGSSAPRQWRESKRSIVEGKMDNERKDQVRFGRGQSKNIRNVITNHIPHWLIQKVLEESKKGARDQLVKYIETKGIAAAQNYAIEQFKRHGITEAQILEKMGKAEIKGLDIEDLLMLSSDLNSIEGGEVHASSLFPAPEGVTVKVDLKSKLASKLGDKIAPVVTETTVDAEAKTAEEVKVRAGTRPFTYFATEGKSEFLVTQSDDGVYTCNCKPKCTDCVHVGATQRFAAQS